MALESSHVTWLPENTINVLESSTNFQSASPPVLDVSVDRPQPNDNGTYTRMCGDIALHYHGYDDWICKFIKLRAMMDRQWDWDGHYYPLIFLEWWLIDLTVSAWSWLSRIVQQASLYHLSLHCVPRLCQYIQPHEASLKYTSYSCPVDETDELCSSNLKQITFLYVWIKNGIFNSHA